MRICGWRWAGAFAVLPCVVAAQTSPSFDCAQKLTSSVEQRICKDPQLAAMDRHLADVYAAALAKTTPADAQTLATAQRGWIKSRNDCWMVADPPTCVATTYRDRIAELSARYRLVQPAGSGHYLCPGPPPQEAIADFFATDPPTALVRFAGATQFMRQALSGSGARYTGGGRQFWEHQGTALITWTPSTQELACPKK